jgi:branched-chain amino acid transport system permease protein
VSEATADVDRDASLDTPVPRRRWPGRSRAVRPSIYDRFHYPSVVIFIVAVALIGPAIADTRAHKYDLNLWLVYSVAALGFYWVFGLAGRFAFCQTFMMALGGYTSAYVSDQGASFLLSVLCGVVAGCAVALVVGVLVRRSQQFYFAIATLAVTAIGTEVFRNWKAFTGPNGVRSNVAPPEILGHEFIQDESVFWLFLGVLAAVLLLAAAIERSPLRREAIAARDNPTVASLAGIAVGRIQLALFVLGSALGALTGALFGHWSGGVSTASFGIDLAIGIFLMLYLGGVGSMWGPVLGAAVYVALPELISGIEKYTKIVYGLLLLVIVLALPQGIVGGFNDLVRKGRSYAGPFRRSSQSQSAPPPQPQSQEPVDAPR